MTQDEAQKMKREITDGYHARADYPPFALVSMADRNRYREYIFRIIDEFAASPVAKKGTRDAK